MARRVWDPNFVIPKAIRLPGLTIRVRIVPHEEVAEYGCKYGCWIYRPAEHPKPRADILLSDSFPIEVQRYTLWHELGHAVHEGLDQLIEKFPEHVQTEAMSKMTTFVHSLSPEVVAKLDELLATREETDGG